MALIYIDISNITDFTIRKYLKITKLHYFLQFFTLFIFSLYLSYLLTFYIGKLSESYTDYTNKHLPEILKLTRSYMIEGGSVDNSSRQSNLNEQIAPKATEENDGVNIVQKANSKKQAPA